MDIRSMTDEQLDAAIDMYNNEIAASKDKRFPLVEERNRRQMTASAMRRVAGVSKQEAAVIAQILGVQGIASEEMVIGPSDVGTTKI
jgi:hypothetical protein